MYGERLTLRPLAAADEAELLRIHSSEAVARWWDLPEDGFPWTDEPQAQRLVIELDGRVVGLIQYLEEASPRFRHASVDLFLDPAVHGRGIGTEALRRVVSHLVGERGHHRITIDPAAENAPAIRCYEKAGFRPVGVMHAYELEPGGEKWRDGLLMELLAGPRAGSPQLKDIG